MIHQLASQTSLRPEITVHQIHGADHHMTVFMPSTVYKYTLGFAHSQILTYLESNEIACAYFKVAAN